MKEKGIKKKDFNDYIKMLDSLDLVSGPICQNIDFKNKQDIRCIKYQNKIPFQYAFKESVIDDLNNFKYFTIFFSCSAKVAA